MTKEKQMPDPVAPAAPVIPAPAPAAPAAPAPAAGDAPVSLASQKPEAKPGDPPAPKPAEPKPGEKPGEKPAEPKPGEKSEEQKRRASDKPIELKDFVLPQGFQKDEKLMGEFTALAKDGRLSQEVGQKLVDLFAKVQTEAGTAWTKLQGDWQKEWTSDAELGGDKLNSTKAIISNAIDSLKPEEATACRKFLDITGAGNNPAIGRLIVRLAKAAGVTEAQPVIGDKPVIPKGEQRSAGEIMYPTQGKPT
jgi:hypothetical protein